MVHGEIDCLDRRPPMPRRRRDEHDQLARLHPPDPVPDEQAIERPTGGGGLSQLFHSRQGKRLVLREFEGSHSALRPDQAKKACDTAALGVPSGELFQGFLCSERMLHQPDVEMRINHR